MLRITTSSPSRIGMTGVVAAVALGRLMLPAVADTVIIHVKPNNSYEPKSQQVKAGDTVQWVNDGGTHTVTPNAGQPDPFAGSQILSSGKTYSAVISGSPRSIKYHCRIHGRMMSGELVVVP